MINSFAVRTFSKKYQHQEFEQYAAALEFSKKVEGQIHWDCNQRQGGFWRVWYQ